MSQSLRILHICAYTWDIGGPPKVIYDNAVVQLANGAEVTICLLYTSPSPRDRG